MDQLSTIVEALQARFADASASQFRGDWRVVVPRAALLEALRLLKEQYGFDLLVDITCVDYLHYRSTMPDRFGLVYALCNTEQNLRLTLRVFVGEEDAWAPSATPIWEGANWLEREVWDLFGVRFEGHPDLRRIVLPEQFSAHPLRKDYPLQGRGERHNFPVLKRGEA